MENEEFRFPTLFQKILKENDISYGIMSKMTGISKSAICNYANGYRTPDIQTGCRIVKSLGLDLDIIEKIFQPCN